MGLFDFLFKKKKSDLPQSEHVPEIRKAESNEIPDFKTIELGNQVWMAENLSIQTDNSWNYNNNEENSKKYGRLYTWDEAVKTCPKGWRLPSDSDWNELINHLGGEAVAGKELQQGGSSGFNAPLAGRRFNSEASYGGMGDFGAYWSSNKSGEDGAWAIGLYSSKPDGYLFSTSGVSFSVRYIKDEPSEENKVEDLSTVLVKILNHVSLVPGTESKQEERIAELINIGPDVLGQIRSAILSVSFGDNTAKYENAGLLCQAIGKIGSDEALDTLNSFAIRPSDIMEYKYIREGAVRGLICMVEKDERVRECLKNIKIEYGLSELIDPVIQQKEEQHQGTQNIKENIMSEQEMFSVLKKLCKAYTENDPVYNELELIATEIGEQLNKYGGIKEMRRIFDQLGGIPGARTLEMHWGGIGDWRG